MRRARKVIIIILVLMMMLGFLTQCASLISFQYI